jgi:hypothetical protein
MRARDSRLVDDLLRPRMCRGRHRRTNDLRCPYARAARRLHPARRPARAGRRLAIRARCKPAPTATQTCSTLPRSFTRGLSRWSRATTPTCSPSRPSGGCGRPTDWSTSSTATAHPPSWKPRSAVSGARLSELLGLRWQDVDLTDACAATIEITGRVDRKGKRQPLKTDSAERTIELPGQLAVILLEHRVGAKHKQPGAFVFCSLSGRCLGQRNVTRALRLAQARRATRGPASRSSRSCRTGPRWRPTRCPASTASGIRPPARRWPRASRSRRSRGSSATSGAQSPPRSTCKRSRAERSARRRSAMEERYGALLEASAERRTPRPSARWST